MLFTADIEIKGKVHEIGIYSENLKQAKIDAAKYGKVVRISRLRPTLAKQFEAEVVTK